jgi:hypothetical protein
MKMSIELVLGSYLVLRPRDKGAHLFGRLPILYADPNASHLVAPIELFSFRGESCKGERERASFTFELEQLCRGPILARDLATVAGTASATMPPAQRRSRTVGSTKSNAIAIDIQDDSEEDVPVASTSKGISRPARSSTRSTAARISSKANTTKPLAKASSKRTRQETSSDTGSSSSDAIFVASSARPPPPKKVDKGKQRERSPPPVAATKSSRNKQTSKPKEEPVAVDIDSDSSVEHLPTPESLVTTSPTMLRRLVCQSACSKLIGHL